MLSLLATQCSLACLFAVRAYMNATSTALPLQMPCPMLSPTNCTATKLNATAHTNSPPASTPHPTASGGYLGPSRKGMTSSDDRNTPRLVHSWNTKGSTPARFTDGSLLNTTKLPLNTALDAASTKPDMVAGADSS